MISVYPVDGLLTAEFESEKRALTLVMCRKAVYFMSKVEISLYMWVLSCLLCVTCYPLITVYPLDTMLQWGFSLAECLKTQENQSFHG